MREPVQPVVVVSKCITFAACRYNGLIIADEFVQRLRPYVDFRPVCAEIEIGLGVPRDPVRVVSANQGLRLIQPATKADLTERMAEFARSFLGSLPEVHGFILKGRSPSCGIRDVKVTTPGGKLAGKGRGFFARAVLDMFPELPVEDEGRLRSWRIREHFLTKLYALARFGAVKAARSVRGLVQFQAENKLLLMAYSQKELKALGRIVANPEKRPLETVLGEYEQHLYAALAQAPRYTSNINVLMHALGYLRGLTGPEKSFFLDSVEKYRAGQVPLGVPLRLLGAWIVRFDEGYLGRQTFFRPYPEELMEISDSGKGRSR